MYRRIYNLLDHRSQGALRLSCFAFFRGSERRATSLDLFHQARICSLYTAVLAFKSLDRLRLCSNGYAGIDVLLLPIHYPDDMVDWNKLHDALQWINPSIVEVRGFAFSSAASWEKLGLLVTERCQVLRLQDYVPKVYRCGANRRAIPISGFPYEPDDDIRPYHFLDMPPEGLSVFQHLPHLHHICIQFPDSLRLAGDISNPADMEMAFISHLSLSCLTLLQLEYVTQQLEDHGRLLDDIDDYRVSSYWAKEQGVWGRLAESEHAQMVQELTEDQERLQW
jgi:hypothetical protein